MENQEYRVSAADVDEAVALTMDMVKIETEAPEGRNYAQFVAFLNDYFACHLPQMKRETVPVPAQGADPSAGRSCFVARSAPRGRTRMHISDHYDVVHAGDPSKWLVTPPYRPLIKDGRIYGRGAADPKGSIAALIQALKIIYREGRTLNYDLLVSFTPDGELSNHTGLDRLIELTQAGADYLDTDVFLSIDGAQNYISTGKTGLLQFFVTIDGKAAHIARSFLGVNANHLGVRLCTDLLDLAERMRKRASDIPVNPELPFPHVRPDLAITRITGGSSFETVPERCEIAGHCLVVPRREGDAMQEAMDELASVILSFKERTQAALRFRIEPAIPPFYTESGNPELLRLAQIAGRTAGLAAYPTACSEGYNDISAVNYRLQVPMFARGVQYADSKAHAYDENVKIEALAISIKDLVEFLSSEKNEK